MNDLSDTDRNFTWPAFYLEFADKLLDYKSDRKALLLLIKESFDVLHNEIGLDFPFVRNGCVRQPESEPVAHLKVSH